MLEWTLVSRLCTQAQVSHSLVIFEEVSFKIVIFEEVSCKMKTFLFCSKEVNYEELARCTDDFNGAQLKAVCVEAVSLILFCLEVLWPIQHCKGDVKLVS